MELSEPVTIIFNTSIKQAQIPRQWKKADVIPVPKQIYSQIFDLYH
jgi:hypothetical protein